MSMVEEEFGSGQESYSPIPWKYAKCVGWDLSNLRIYDNFRNKRECNFIKQSRATVVSQSHEHENSNEAKMKKKSL